MTHPNAHLFAELAERAKTKTNPYEGLQLKSDGEWFDWLPGSLCLPLAEGWQWRFRPEPVTVEAWAVVRKQNKEVLKVWSCETTAKAYCPSDCLVLLMTSEPFTPEGQQ